MKENAFQYEKRTHYQQENEYTFHHIPDITFMLFIRKVIPDNSRSFRIFDKDPCY